MTYLGIVSAVLLAFGWVVGASVDYPWTGLAIGLSAVFAIIVFLGDDA